MADALLIAGVAPFAGVLHSIAGESAFLAFAAIVYGLGMTASFFYRSYARAR